MDEENSQSQQYMYPPQQGFPMPDNKADLLDKIRPEETIEEIKQKLMGKEWNTIKEIWQLNPALTNFALTEVGASSIATLIFPTCSRTSSLSNLDEKIIWNRWLEIIRTLEKNILDNWEDWGIRSVAQIYWVSSIVKSSVLISLKQPENEGIRRLLNSVITENRSVNTFGEEKRGSILGLFRGNK
jgi:hypothetical protein